MNKIIFFYSIIFISLLTIAGIGTAQTKLDNPLDFDTFCGLLTEGIIPAVAGIVGAVSVIMITVAGIMYLLSAGDPGRMGTAKTALFYAIIGLVIAISAGAIVATIKEVINAGGGGGC